MKGGFRQINVILSGDEFRCSACASFQLCRNINALSIWFHTADAFGIVNQQATHPVGILLQLLLGLGTAPFLIRLYAASRHIQNAANFGILQRCLIINQREQIN